MDDIDILRKVASKVSGCERCFLHKERKNVVPGEGDSDAEIMLIGEGPGKNEDIQGKPFVGRAGKLLDELLDSAGMERSSVFITNIVKCRPPRNRDPREDEIEACSKYLDRQIKAVNPDVIGTLGNHATSYIFKKYNLREMRIGKVHGKVYTIHNKHVDKIVPLYHPAAAIYNRELEEVLQADFLKLKKSIEENNLWDY